MLGVFLTPGAKNEALASLAAAFPAKAVAEALVEDVDPNGLLPASLAYWELRGLADDDAAMLGDRRLDGGTRAAAGWRRRHRQVHRAYRMNARPVLAPNRRFILTTS